MPEDARAGNGETPDHGADDGSGHGTCDQQEGPRSPRRPSRQERTRAAGPATAVWSGFVGVTAAVLRGIGEAGLITPLRSGGGRCRYFRYRLRIAARVRDLVDRGNPIEAACRIVILEGRLAEVLRIKGAAPIGDLPGPVRPGPVEGCPPRCGSVPVRGGGKPHRSVRGSGRLPPRGFRTAVGGGRKSSPPAAALPVLVSMSVAVVVPKDLQVPPPASCAVGALSCFRCFFRAGQSSRRLSGPRSAVLDTAPL